MSKVDSRISCDAGNKLIVMLVVKSVVNSSYVSINVSDSRIVNRKLKVYYIPSICNPNQSYQSTSSNPPNVNICVYKCLPDKLSVSP